MFILLSLLTKETFTIFNNKYNELKICHLFARLDNSIGGRVQCNYFEKIFILKTKNEFKMNKMY